MMIGNGIYRQKFTSFSEMMRLTKTRALAQGLKNQV